MSSPSPTSSRPPAAPLPAGARLPGDILTLIALHVHAHLLPPPSSLTSLDPLPTSPTFLPTSPPSALPSTSPSPQWPQWLVFHTLLSLTRTSSAWRNAALPALFWSLQVTYPRSWLGLLAILCGPEITTTSPPTASPRPADDPPDPDSDLALLTAHLSLAAESLFISTSGRARSPSREDALRVSALSASIRHALAMGSPGYHIPPELLSPPESRESSPAVRGRRGLEGGKRNSSASGRSPSSTRSPSRWRLARRVSDARADMLRPRGVYVPALRDTAPGTHIRELTFAHFRTIHMRLPASTKTPGSGEGGGGGGGRFVTQERLLRLLREVPGLRAFGGTEYMDSALGVGVLEELLLRGLGGGGNEGRGRSGERKDLRGERRGRERERRGRRGEMESVVAPPAREENDPEVEQEPDGSGQEPEQEQEGQEHAAGAEEENGPDPEDVERWNECVPLEALDLCGCVSPVCVQAVGRFVQRHSGDAGIAAAAGTAGGTGGGTAGGAAAGTAGEGTPGKQLPLQRLGMAGMATLPPPILERFILLFPQLRMLDISGTLAPPSLLSALSHSPTLKLTALSLARCPRLTGSSVLDFLLSRPCAELEHLNLYGDDSFPSPLSPSDVSTLVRSPLLAAGNLTYLDLSSSPLSPSDLSALPAQPALRSLGLSHIPSLPLSYIRLFLLQKAPQCEVLTLAHSCTPELSPSHRPGELSLALHTGFLTPLCSPPFSLSGPPRPAATRLRVLELAPPVLALLAEGAPPWRPVRSRGRRAWYVDSSSGWASGAFVRGLWGENSDAPWRRQVEEWARARGNVGTGVGWHARKMEVLRGEGMTGRSDGLYGMVAYAYAG
ncbi:hypothetical protein CALVIDRAFT_537045 [Calocera viscosa TUFC12733]|uniref:Uncharacterized protein n=1 Tax=Calocera viscosa (strain TUFC12733) TaxID=1330018 RepID=A0A167MGY0_CALVF|nr:hypothetical protein CALVIDRAFT_537045 [Calocera viscosa TUFC12733]